MAARWASYVSTLCLQPRLHMPLRWDVDFIAVKEVLLLPCKSLTSHSDRCGTPPHQDGVDLTALLVFSQYFKLPKKPHRHTSVLVLTSSVCAV